jgi:hypothetical protein
MKNQQQAPQKKNKWYDIYFSKFFVGFYLDSFIRLIIMLFVLYIPLGYVANYFNVPFILTFLVLITLGIFLSPLLNKVTLGTKFLLYLQARIKENKEKVNARN